MVVTLELGGAVGAVTTASSLVVVVVVVLVGVEHDVIAKAQTAIAGRRMINFFIMDCGFILFPIREHTARQPYRLQTFSFAFVSLGRENAIVARTRRLFSDFHRVGRIG